MFNSELNDAEKEKLISSRLKYRLNEYDSRMCRIIMFFILRKFVCKLDFLFKGDFMSARKPWRPNSKRPVDLRRSDKLLYSSRANPNDPIGNNHTLNSQILKYNSSSSFANSLSKSYDKVMKSNCNYFFLLSIN